MRKSRLWVPSEAELNFLKEEYTFSKATAICLGVVLYSTATPNYSHQPTDWLSPRHSLSIGGVSSHSSGGRTRVRHPSRSRWGRPVALSTWYTRSKWGATACCSQPCQHRPQGCQQGPLPCRAHRPRKHMRERDMWHRFESQFHPLYLLGDFGWVKRLLCSYGFPICEVG